ncbi:MAG: methyltransferase domain-containing protein [Candidatus Moranbacteria bacterium]|nr:methyltransferase domain-containing protein [Candidatus Moranbacteria bacterium]
MLSLLRKYEYAELEKLSLDGEILDLGGSRKSNYHGLLQGSHEITVVNFDEKYGFDLNFNLEEKFPLGNESYDNLLAINVLEHIFNYGDFFAESYRILKPGGKMVLTSPFFHQIHGCPYDYNRFTEDALKKISLSHNFEIVSLKVLGSGIFSAIYQMLIGLIPTSTLKYIFQSACVFLDKLLILISRRYEKIAKNYPLGYVLILKKSERK